MHAGKRVGKHTHVMHAGKRVGALTNTEPLNLVGARRESRGQGACS